MSAVYSVVERIVDGAAFSEIRNPVRDAVRDVVVQEVRYDLLTVKFEEAIYRAVYARVGAVADERVTHHRPASGPSAPAGPASSPS